MLTLGARARARTPSCRLPEPVNLPWERVLPAQPGGRASSRTRCPAAATAACACVRGSRRAAAPVQAPGRRVRPPRDRLARLPAHHRAAAPRPRPQAPRFFRHKKWMAYVITDFSNSYFQAFADYERGRPVPSRGGTSTTPRRAATPTRCRTCCCSPTPTPSTTCRYLRVDGPAHPRRRVAQARPRRRQRDQRARHPEDQGRDRAPLRPDVRDVPGPLDEMGGLEPTKTWREAAWRNAERLTAAPGEAARSPGGGPDREPTPRRGAG